MYVNHKMNFGFFVCFRFVFGYNIHMKTNWTKNNNTQTMAIL